MGVVNDKKSSMAIRPGVPTDMLRIPVYQVDSYTEGTNSALYEYVADVVITGDDVECLVPEGSSVDVTLKVNTSEMMQMEVYFPTLDITIEKELDTSRLQSIEEATKQIPRDIRVAQTSIDNMSEAGIDVLDLQEQLNLVKEEHKNSSEKKAVLQHLKEVLRKIEDKDIATEWERLEQEIRDEFDRLERANNDLGDDKTTMLVNQLRKEVDKIIRTKDVNLGIDVKEQVHSLFFHITLLYQLIAFIKQHNDHFDFYQWKDKNRARQLLNQAISKINDQPTKDELHPIVVALINLLPDDEQNSFLVK